MQTGSCLRKPKKRSVIRKPLHHYQNPQIGLILSRVPWINLPRCFFSGLATVLALRQQNADTYWDICHRTPSQCMWHFASSSLCMYSISFSYLVLLPVYEINMVVLSCLWCFYQKQKNHIFGVLFAVFLQQDKFEYLFKEGIFKAIYCESYKN